jgi:hypothetical protein
MSYSPNDKLFTSLHTANITYSAGPGSYKDHQFMTLGESSADDKNAIDDLHLFWQKERRGLYNYLMSSKFRNLFEGIVMTIGLYFISSSII